MTRIAHLSDPHISASVPAFTRNFEMVTEHVRAAKPDLVIDTGDLALDGADRDQDLIDSLRLHADLGRDTYVLPGNHDVGDDPVVARRQPATPERLARWRRLVGPSHWVLDVPGWRILGLNALVLDTDLDEAGVQDEAIRAATRALGGRALALFLHKPVTDAGAETEGVNPRFLSPGQRRSLASALGDARPRLVASGHVHQYRANEIAGTQHVWAPATSFFIGDPWQPVYGAKTVGYVEHHLRADGTCSHRLVTVRGLPHIDIVNVPEAYGDVRRLGPGGA